MSSVRYAVGTGEPYVTVTDPADYYIDEHGLHLTGLGAVSTFYEGHATVEITGVFGFASIPPLIEAATLAIARELYQSESAGRPVGIDYGRLPLIVKSAIQRYRKRTFAWV